MRVYSQNDIEVCFPIYWQQLYVKIRILGNFYVIVFIAGQIINDKHVINLTKIGEKFKN